MQYQELESSISKLDLIKRFFQNFWENYKKRIYEFCFLVFIFILVPPYTLLLYYVGNVKLAGAIVSSIFLSPTTIAVLTYLVFKAHEIICGQIPEIYKKTWEELQKEKEETITEV